MNEPRQLARDPVTGMSELHAVPSRNEKPTADELANRIRGTRARMTAIIDELEERLAPARIADEVKSSIRDTIDDVRDQIHPREMARRAGDTMLETIKENPIPAMAAGLSIGWLIMKGMESDERAERRRFTRSGYEPYSSVPWRGGREDRPWEYDDRYGHEAESVVGHTPAQAYAPHVSEGEHESRREHLVHRAEDMKHRMSEQGEVARERISETAHHVRDQASTVAHKAGHQARRVGHTVGRNARRAENSIEEFVHRNPLVAALITAGVGAIVGAAFPATERENELMGHTRDRVMDRARDMVEETSDQAREVARRVGDEAKHHAQELAETAKQEAKNVRSSDSESSSLESERPAITTSSFGEDNTNRPF